MIIERYLQRQFIHFNEQDGNMPYSGAILKIYIYLYRSYISMQTTIGVPFVYKRIQYIKQQSGTFSKTINYHLVSVSRWKYLMHIYHSKLEMYPVVVLFVRYYE